MNVLNRRFRSLDERAQRKVQWHLSRCSQPIVTLHEQRLDHSDVEKEQRDDQSQREAHGNHHSVHKSAPR